MITLNSLKPFQPKKRRKIVGRGNASGHGNFSGKGIKGQNARSGGGVRPGFEGGRTSLIMQTPKMRGDGFRSPRARWFGVNLSSLNKFTDGDKVTVAGLKRLNLFKYGRVKILGEGNLTKRLEVCVPVSAAAKEKIEKAGGKVIAASGQANSPAA